MPVEFKLGADGIPYVVEFANVSIWPRRPEGQPQEHVHDDMRKPHKRAHTLPALALAIDKPLPSLPAPERSASFKRIFRRRQSEPVPTTPISEHWQAIPHPHPHAPPRRRSATVSRAERDAKTRDPLATLSLFSMSQATLVESDDEATALGADARPTPVPPDAPPPRVEPGQAAAGARDADSDDLDIRSGGLLIAFRDDPIRSLANVTAPPSVRLRRLSHAVADAVAAAGMISPTNRPAPQQEHEQQQQGQSRAGRRQDGKSLFRGTYGQVRTAFRSAGLVIRKCDEQGVEGAARVGTLFVANRDGHDNVIFTKVVLFGAC